MAIKLAVAVIHGMGAQEPNFADHCVEEVFDRVADRGKDPTEIAWTPVYWADILQPRETDYLVRANAANDLDYLGLRRFVVSAIGDAAAYQVVGDPNNSTYNDIHARVDAAMRALRDQLTAPADTPLVVMAHSLGGHIMSNYIYDRQKRRMGPGPRDFTKMDTLAGIVTFGCNIPIFTFAYRKGHIVPIKVPAPRLPQRFRALAQWLNFFDPDDVLGYPLKSINAAYDRVVTKDVSINAGGPFSSWNPMSHSEYWTDDDFTKPVAHLLASFL